MLRMGCEPILDQHPREAFLRHACHDRGRPGPASGNLVIGELKTIRGIPQQLKIVREICHNRRRVGLAKEGAQLGSKGGIRQGRTAAVEQRVNALTNEIGWAFGQIGSLGVKWRSPSSLTSAGLTSSLPVTSAHSVSKK